MSEAPPSADLLRVSVVIPAYRAAGTIARAIESVLAQTSPAHEIIVVDDGSPDALRAALQPYERRVMLLRKENGGAASARNLGIEQSTGELLAFLDADDYWEAHKLERHVALYRRHPELGLTCSRYFEQLPQGERIETRPAPGVNYDCVQHVSGRPGFELGTSVWTGTVVVPRTVLGEHRFASGLEPAEDRHLWVRLATARPVYFLSEPLATAVLEPGSLSRGNVDRDCTSMLRVVDDFAALLGSAGLREWKIATYRRWAGVHISNGRWTAAIRPSLQRWRRDPWSLEAWYVLGRIAAEGIRWTRVNCMHPLRLADGPLHGCASSDEFRRPAVARTHEKRNA